MPACLTTVWASFPIFTAVGRIIWTRLETMA